MNAKVPHFVKMTAAVAVIGLLLVGFFAIRLASAQHTIDRAACVRAVEAREDNRAMWLYLVNKNPDPSAPDVVAFVDYLNERLPSLRCEGPVPVAVDASLPE